MSYLMYKIRQALKLSAIKESLTNIVHVFCICFLFIVYFEGNISYLGCALLALEYQNNQDAN